MTVPIFPPSIERRFQALEKAVYNSRGTVGDSSAVLQFTPGGQLILPGGTLVLGDLSSIGIPPAPTNLVLNPGAGNGDIWIDANWTPAGTGSNTPVSWGILVLKQGDTVPFYFNPPANAAPPYRISGLLPNSTYSVTVWGITQLGAASQNLGPQNATTGIDTTVPTAPANVNALAGYKSITMTWDGIGGSPPNDWKGTYQAQAATNSGFTTGVISQNVGAATVATFGSLVTGQNYWVRVRAVSPSLVNGTFSSIVGPVTPGQAQGSFEHSDGLVPTTTTAAPTVTPGIGILYIKWVGISNNDLVTYELHLSTTSGFTASSSTKVGEISEGTIGSIKTLNNNTPLAYATDYYVRIYPKDKDGYTSAGPSPQTGPVRIVQVNTADIAAHSITADSAIINDITASVITTGTLNANIVDVINLNASNITTGTIAANIAYLGTVAANKITAGSLSAGVILTSSLSASQITTGTMSAARISSGTINAGVITLSNGGLIQSANYGATTGWRIDAAGNTFLNNAVVRGNILGATITGGTLQTNTAPNPRLVISSLSPEFVDFYAKGDEQVPARIFVDQNVDGGSYRLWLFGANPVVGTFNAPQVILKSDVGHSDLYLEADNIFIRAPGPQFATSIHLFGNMGDDIVMNDHSINFRFFGDGFNYMKWQIDAGSVANGTQGVDGPMIHGFNAVGLGGRNDYGIGFRVYADGTTFRNDSYNFLYALQGFAATGSKVFQIDHPVKGPEHYLTFSSVEGPRADLYYRGKVVLDNTGHTEINLDSYFEMVDGTFNALNFADNRQVMLYNETSNAHASYTLTGPVLTISGAANETIGWLVITERGDDSMLGMANTDQLGHIVNERAKSSFEKDNINI
jgi:hypothetical protein